ncbi:hypothetical protein TYRP_019791 [Tyrophagus putrescentiae]|nr:hypothetical protein TYRP_019791 [Tyrophagus putrescentiae]
MPFSSEPQDRRRPGWMATRTDDDEDGWRPGLTTTRTEDDLDGRQPGRSGWTTGMDNQDGRRRKLKTEDRRPKIDDDGGEEAGNRTVALPKRQSTLAVDLLKRWGTPATNDQVPQDITVPPRTWGGPKRTVDKDGRLSEDGEADG